MNTDTKKDIEVLSSKKKITENIGVYAAAGIGAFFLGVSDLLSHETGSMVEKIAEMLQREGMFPNIQFPLWISLLLLIVLGILACWIHRPKERNQGFMTGFSVFALLTVGIPQSEPLITSKPPPISASAGGGQTTELKLSPSPVLPTSESSLFSFFVSSALADEHLSKDNKLISQTLQKGSITILLRDSEGKKLKNIDHFIVTLVNQTSSARKKYRFSGTKISITDTFDNYKLFIEMEGYRNTYTHFGINNVPQVAYTLTLDSSSIPIGLQKLGSPEKKDLDYDAFETERLRGISLFERGEYEQAIQYYNKILKRYPNHAEIINFKGYAFYRWGRYQEAENVLSKGILKHPDNILIRLNLAKSYCKLEKNTEADNILFKQLSLSETQKQFICHDQEFINVCPMLTQHCSLN